MLTFILCAIVCLLAMFTGFVFGLAILIEARKRDEANQEARVITLSKWEYQRI